MFDSVFLLGHIEGADWANIFLSDLRSAFEDIGLDSWLHIIGRDNADMLGQQLRDSPNSFVIDINSKIATGDWPKFSLIVDHPFVHAHLATPGAQTVFGMVDAEHAKLSGYTTAPTVFVPHGGPVPAIVPNDTPRDIDVLLVGNIGPHPQAANRAEEIAIEVGRRWSHICGDPFVDFLETLRNHGLGPETLSQGEFAKLAGLATNEAQRLARLAAISSMGKCAFHLVGELPSHILESLPANIVVHGFNRSFEQSCDLMRRTKVVVNVSNKFPHGSHERIWYAMAYGCAVVTARSSFVEQSFVHGRNILFYDTPTQIGDLVQSLLPCERASDLATAAMPIYEARHTWLDRATRILVAMQQKL